MTTTTYPSPTTHTTTADPWDAPYFGGAVYFQYRAPMTPAAQTATSTPKVAAPNPPTSQPQRVFATDPWDAPYFGGPIYLRFPEFTGPMASSVNTHVEAAPDHGAVETATPAPSQPSLAVLPSESTTTSSEATPMEPEIVAARPTQRGRWDWLASLLGRC